MLYEAGVDPLIAMKIVGHTDYQTTANIYTHVRDEMLKKATMNMNEVFQHRSKDEERKSSTHTAIVPSSIKNTQEDLPMIYVGIDVSKDKHVCTIQVESARGFPNPSREYNLFCSRCLPVLRLRTFRAHGSPAAARSCPACCPPYPDP